MGAGMDGERARVGVDAWRWLCGVGDAVGVGTGGNGRVGVARVVVGTWRWHSWEWAWVAVGARGTALWVHGMAGAASAGFSAPVGRWCGFGARGAGAVSALGVPTPWDRWWKPMGCSLGCPDLLLSAAQLDAFGDTRLLGDSRGTCGLREIGFGVFGRCTLG